MGRLKKTGLDYFPFDVDTFSDIKIRKLIKYQSSKAIAVYALLLCNIYKNGYYMMWDEELPFIISEQTGYDEAYIREVIKSCMLLGLFDKSLFEKEKVLTSGGIQARYREILRQCKRTVIMDKYRINSEEMPISSEEKDINSEEMPINSEKSTQKKSKVKKRKENCSFSEAEEGKQEQQQFFFEIMFWRNLKNPRKESERFVNWNAVHGWTTQCGERFDTLDRRAALARMWEPKESGDRCNGKFLSAWRDTYELVKQKKPDVAALMVDECAGVRCYGGNVEYSVPKVLLEHLSGNNADATPLFRYASGLPVRFKTYG